MVRQTLYAAIQQVDGMPGTMNRLNAESDLVDW